MQPKMKATITLSLQSDTEDRDVVLSITEPFRIDVINGKDVLTAGILTEDKVLLQAVIDEAVSKGWLTKGD